MSKEQGNIMTQNVCLEYKKGYFDLEHLCFEQQYIRAYK